MKLKLKCHNNNSGKITRIYTEYFILLDTSER